MKVLGLSSGTSHDAIDVAIVEFELRGDVLEGVLHHSAHVPYPAGVRTDILSALPPNPTSLGLVCRIDTLVGQCFAEAAAAAVEVAGPVDVVCSHGQTVFHWVDGAEALGTLQLGQPAWIAERLGVPVVSDVRARDVAAGGQGAPLVSLLDSLVLGVLPAPAGALNLGGIANLTVAGDPPIAYDIGPANALLDAAVLAATGRPYDRDGELAARGRVDEGLLAALLAEPYYGIAPPKTTGKELFHAGYLVGVIGEWRAAGRDGAEVERVPSGGPVAGVRRMPGGGVAAEAERVPSGGPVADAESMPVGAESLSIEDLLATLTSLTAAIVADEIRRHGLKSVVVSGGGVDNPVLMAAIAARADGVSILRSDAVGIPADAKEAVAFALIGWYTVHGLAATIPSCTGARGGRVLGRITPGDGPLMLPPPLAGPPVSARFSKKFP